MKVISTEVLGTTSTNITSRKRVRLKETEKIFMVRKNMISHNKWLIYEPKLDVNQPSSGARSEQTKRQKQSN